MRTELELTSDAFYAMLAIARSKQGLMRDRVYYEMLDGAKKTTARFATLPANTTEREFRIRLVSQQAGGQVDGETTYFGYPANAQPWSRAALEAALERNAWDPFRATLDIMGRD